VLEAVGAVDVDASPFSTEMREVKSWVSDENCEAEVCEFREMLLADGDTALGFDCFNAEMFFPLPRTRPPPSILRDITIGHKSNCAQVRADAWIYL
jgi:hypothetical protein